jgi:Glucose / Sorbosone dehydrogenase
MSAETRSSQKPEAGLPFVMTKVATFNVPWRLAFLPDGRMLITEKVGPINDGTRMQQASGFGDSVAQPNCQNCGLGLPE